MEGLSFYFIYFGIFWNFLPKAQGISECWVTSMIGGKKIMKKVIPIAILSEYLLCLMIPFSCEVIIFSLINFFFWEKLKSWLQRENVHLFPTVKVTFYITMAHLSQLRNQCWFITVDQGWCVLGGRWQKGRSVPTFYQWHMLSRWHTVIDVDFNHLAEVCLSGFSTVKLLLFVPHFTQ